jgi:hypothetical protein
VNRYTLELENDQIHNIIPLIEFLSSNQGNDIEIIVNQEFHCLRFCKIYDLLDKFNFNSVTIYTANPVEYHDKYLIKPLYHWSAWFSRDSINSFDYSIDYDWNQSNIFGCFYGRPNASRIGIASYLNKNYPTQSLIKLRFDTVNEDQRRNFELQKLYSWHPEILPSVADLLANIEKKLSEFHAYNYTTFKYDFSNDLNLQYRHIFVDLIVEATLAGNSFCPSEKVARAILCKKPFIAMAPAFYLRYLKQMGFKTFDEVWSEDYDDLELKNRYFAILKIIDKLGNLSTEQLLELNNKLQPIVEHNYQLLSDTNFLTSLVRIIPHYEK